VGGAEPAVLRARAVRQERGMRVPAKPPMLVHPTAPGGGTGGRFPEARPWPCCCSGPSARAGDAVPPHESVLRADSGWEPIHRPRIGLQRTTPTLAAATGRSAGRRILVHSGTRIVSAPRHRTPAAWPGHHRREEDLGSPWHSTPAVDSDALDSALGGGDGNGGAMTTPCSVRDRTPGTALPRRGRDGHPVCACAAARAHMEPPCRPSARSHATGRVAPAWNGPSCRHRGRLVNSEEGRDASHAALRTCKAPAGRARHAIRPHAARPLDPACRRPPAPQAPAIEIAWSTAGKEGAPAMLPAAHARCWPLAPATPSARTPSARTPPAARSRTPPAARSRMPPAAHAREWCHSFPSGGVPSVSSVSVGSEGLGAKETKKRATGQ
jgi:hypothetical protein